MAAELYLKADPTAIGIGESAKVELFLDSPEGVNAVQGVVAFPPQLKIKEVSDGNSIINLWVERPAFKGQEVSFSGISPGGYAKEHGLVLTIFVEGKSVGSDAVFLKEAQAFLNDGQGTPASLLLRRATIKVAAVSTGEQLAEEEDDVPPSDFRPVIASDPNIFDGKYFVTFATQDKGSGIDYYEVAEERSFFRPRPEIWERAESPYLLKDQELKSWVLVRAADRAGNSRTEVLRPGKIPAYQQPLTIILILFVVIVLIIWRLRKNIF